MALADAVRDAWLPFAQSSPALGLQIDESTTCSSEGTLIIYLRFHRHGVAVTKFWKLVQVKDGKAETIFNALEQAFREDDIDPSAVFSMSTDGASVMLGSQSGVATLCKAAWNGVMIITHCIAHREALAVGDSYAANAEALAFERTLRDILHYYKDSNKRKSHLVSLQQQVGIPELAMLKLHSVRWLSRAGVAKRTLHNWPALVQEFAQEANSAKPINAEVAVDPLKWQQVGASLPAHGMPLQNQALAEALIKQTAFLEKEWAAFKVSDLSERSYVETKIDNTTVYFSPMRRVAQSSAAALHATIVSHRFVLALCGFTDVLNAMALLSRLFQCKLVRFRSVSQQLDCLKASLARAYGDGPHMGGDEYRLLRRAISSTQQGVGPRRYTFRGVSIQHDEADGAMAMAGVKKLANDIISNLSDRFPSSPLLSALQVFDMRELPSTRSHWNRVASYHNRESLNTILAVYGRPTAHESGGAFPAVVDPAAFRCEWPVFIEQLTEAWYEYCEKTRPLHQKCPKDKEEHDELMIEIFYADFFERDTLPEVSKLAAIWMIQTLSTVDCERGFSSLALIKTRLRNRLYVCTVDALMQVSLCAPDMHDHAEVNKIVDSAYHIWVRTFERNARKSHPGVSGRKKKTATRSAKELLDAVGRLDGDDDDEDDDDDDDLPLYLKEMRRDANPHKEGGGGGVDGDGVGGDGGEEAREEAAGKSAERQTFRVIPPYVPPEGYTILPKPSEADWIAAQTPAPVNMVWWTRKRVVTKWTIGWFEGTFKGRTYSGELSQRYEVYFSGRYHDNVVYRESYGMEL